MQVCRTPEKAVNKKELVTLDFVKGLPTSVNGKSMKLSEIVLKLNEIGAKHAVGIATHIEDRVVGLKVRGIYEAPAAEIIITAHRNLEKYVSTRQENEFKSVVDTKWAYLCYGAFWLEPLFEDLNAFINQMNNKVTGKVTLSLYKGVVEAVAVDTPNTIFEEKLATFMKSSAFNQNASAGFIELYTLQMRLAQRSERTALISIGKRSNKLKLLPTIKDLSKMGYKLYATYKTHKFLNTNKIEAILVHKISTPNKHPNLRHLLSQNRFDVIISIPTGRKTKEITDRDYIQDMALKTHSYLITNVEVAKEFVNKLSTI